MATAKDHRRSNLLVLEKRYGSLEELKKKTGVSASYLSQMKKFRHMGEKVARQIEKKLNLPEGWMDLPQGGGARVVNAPSWAPNAEVQEFLEAFLSIPEQFRPYLTRRAKALRAYAESLTPFQRSNMRPPPDDPHAFEQWVKALEEELARTRPPSPKRKTRV